MKTLKEQMDICSNENPELTYVCWQYGMSLYQWAAIGVQLRFYIALIRHSKGLSEISFYTENKRLIDGQRLVEEFIKSCEHPLSYADIPHYEDLKRSLNKALDARNFLAHKFLPEVVENIQGYASKDSAEDWKKRVYNEGIKAIHSRIGDIYQSLALLNKVSPEIGKRLETSISSLADD